jgi:hypothetical protein
MAVRFELKSLWIWFAFILTFLWCGLSPQTLSIPGQSMQQDYSMSQRHLFLRREIEPRLLSFDRTAYHSTQTQTVTAYVPSVGQRADTPMVQDLLLKVAITRHTRAKTAQNIPSHDRNTASRHPVAVIDYTVQPGNTLWALSQLYGIPVGRIQESNHLSGVTIYPGQKLRLVNPSSHPPAMPRLLKNAPAQLIPIYMQAAARYKVPWTVLAAIHKTETDFSLGGPITSCAGAEGPMQFMPATFAEFGVAAPGVPGPPDIDNVEDAIYSAAHMLSVDGFDNNPWQAVWDYNHSARYVSKVLQIANF